MGQPGGGVQDAVAQGLGLGAGEGAVEGEQLEPRQQGGGGQGQGLGIVALCSFRLTLGDHFLGACDPGM